MITQLYVGVPTRRLAGLRCARLDAMHADASRLLAACATGAAAALALILWYERRAAADAACRARQAHRYSHSETSVTSITTVYCCDRGDPEMPSGTRAAIGRAGAIPASHCDEGAPEMPSRMRAALERAEAARAPSKPSAPVEKPPLGMVMQLAKETGASRADCKAALEVCGNRFDEARARLAPDLSSPPPAAAERIHDTFETCEKFAGGRPGWTFKRGPHGVGYYREPATACPPGGAKNG